MKLFAKKNNCNIFKAAELFFDDNYCRKYRYGLDSISNILYRDFERTEQHLNGNNIKNVIQKIQNEQNEQCFPVAKVYLKCAFKRYILITESNRFFLDDGRYLGDDYEDIVYKIFSNEIIVKPILCDKVFITLKRHGWDKDKKQDISNLIEGYHKHGIELFDAAKELFEIIPQGKYYRWWKHHHGICSSIIGKSEKRYFNNNHEKYHEIIGEKLLNICSEEQYAYFIYISESGKFYYDRDLRNIHYITDDYYLLIQWLLLEHMI